MNLNPVIKLGRGRGRGRKQSDNLVSADAEDDDVGVDNCVPTKSLPTNSISVENLSFGESSVPHNMTAFVPHETNIADTPKPSKGRGRGRGNLVVGSYPNDPIANFKITRSRSSFGHSSALLGPGAISLSSYDNAVFNTCNNKNEEIFQQPPPPGKSDHILQPVHVSDNLPRYLNTLPQHSKRLQKLKSAKVKLLKVVDDTGFVDVMFQDEDSIIRFKLLQEKMQKFYTSPEGREFRLPIKSLQIGEIVAANIFSNNETITYRRVKILTIVNKTSSYDDSAYVVDIDDLCELYVKVTFALHKNFHQYPLQVCRLKITNFHSLHPKDCFEAFYDCPQTFTRAMTACSIKVLKGLLLQTIFITNISVRDGLMYGKLNPNLNWRFHSGYLNAFCNIHMPVLPKETSITEGEITYLSADGKIGVALYNPLSEPMNKIIDEYELKTKDSEITEGATEKMLKMIHSGECRMFLARYGKEKKYRRVRIKSFYEEKLKGVFIDVGAEKVITCEDLVCALANNPNLPSILAEIPSQVIMMHLAGVNRVSTEKCKELIGMHVKFKIFLAVLPTRLPEVKIYPLTSLESLNELISDNMYR